MFMFRTKSIIRPYNFEYVRKVSILLNCVENNKTESRKWFARLAVIQLGRHFALHVNYCVCDSKAIYDMFICQSKYPSGKSFVTPRNTMSDLVTKGMVTHYTCIVKCCIRVPVSWIEPETRTCMRMKETDWDLIIVKCDAGEYRVCFWAFTGESVSFLSALYPRQRTGYTVTVEMTIFCVRIMHVL